MIDFETLGDLFRKSKITQRIKMKDTPVIIVDGGDAEVWFVFDSAGNLKDIVIVH